MFLEGGGGGGFKLVPTKTVGLKSLHYACTRLWRSSLSGDAASFTTSFDEKSFQIKADFSKLQKKKKTANFIEFFTSIFEIQVSINTSELIIRFAKG